MASLIEQLAPPLIDHLGHDLPVDRQSLLIAQDNQPLETGPQYDLSLGILRSLRPPFPILADLGFPFLHSLALFFGLGWDFPRPLFVAPAKLHHSAAPLSFPAAGS